MDGCYSFWVGGLFPLIHTALNSLVSASSTENSDDGSGGGGGNANVGTKASESSTDEMKKEEEEEEERKNSGDRKYLENLRFSSAKMNAPAGFLMNIEELQKYIIVCCQMGKGGLIDKPGK